MKFAPISIIGAALLLTACEDVAPIKGAPVDPQFKSQQVADRVQGYTEPVVRTYIREEPAETNPAVASTDPFIDQGEKIEVSNATCVADSAEIRSQFSTPARLRLPVYKGKPTPLHVTCTGNGHTQTFTVNPSLDGVIVGDASPVGLVAAAVTAGIAAANDKWSYGVNGAVYWIRLDKEDS